MKQGLAEAAEAVHKEGVRLKPDDPERLEAYADFLSDVGRNEEAEGLYVAGPEMPTKGRMTLALTLDAPGRCHDGQRTKD